MTVQLLLDALSERDFAAVDNCFSRDAEMRALLPSGPAVFTGVDEIMAAFQKWFRDPERFEVLAGATGAVGSREQASWRFRVDSTPRGARGWHVIEQQVYADVSDRIDAIDLLCSGFVPES